MNQETARKKVVLVVDDEEGMRDMLGWRLGDSEFDIKLARNGEEAIAILGRDMIDLVVTDLTMPRCGGLKLLDAIGGKTAVIVITGFGTVEMAVHAIRNGASDFLLKPFDPQYLLQRIREVLGGLVQ